MTPKGGVERIDAASRAAPAAAVYVYFSRAARRARSMLPPSFLSAAFLSLTWRDAAVADQYLRVLALLFFSLHALPYISD